MSLREVVKELENLPAQAEVAIQAKDLREVGAKIDEKIPDLLPVKVTVGTVRELVAKAPAADHDPT